MTKLFLFWEWKAGSVFKNQSILPDKQDKKEKPHDPINLCKKNLTKKHIHDKNSQQAVIEGNFLNLIKGI